MFRPRPIELTREDIGNFFDAVIEFAKVSIPAAARLAGSLVKEAAAVGLNRLSFFADGNTEADDLESQNQTELRLN